MRNFYFVHSDEEEESNTEFSMINPDLLELELEDIDGVSNSPVASVTVDNLLIPNRQFIKYVLS